MSIRTLGSILVLLAVGWLLVGQVRHLLADPTIWPPDDYVQYWAAGRLNLAGNNPYSAELLLPLEREAGRVSTATGEAGHLDEAIMMWNPPWTLSAAMPLGSVPARVGQFLWLAVGMAAIGLSADRLWLLYGGRPERRWLGWLLAATWVPSLIALNTGQIVPLLLLGATLFGLFAKQDRLLLAGIVAVLLAIKPHLVYLLWPLVAVDALDRREWRLVVGGILGGVLASLWPVVMNPEVFQQYFTEMSQRPPAQWVSLTIGSLLRLALGDTTFGLQFLPVPIGMFWGAVYWWKWRRSWNWAEVLPAIVLVSFVTAPYGAWHFDLLLLLVPLMVLAARATGRTAIVFWTAFAAIDVVMLVLNLTGVASIWFAWVAPVVLVLYFLLERPIRRGD